MLHRALQRREARLRSACNPKVAGLECRQQWLNIARDLRLLQCHPHSGLDVDHQGLVTRARKALHQLFELRALQRDLGQARFRQRQPGRRVAHRFLRLPRARARASVDCARASALWRASCSCMPSTFCRA